MYSSTQGKLFLPKLTTSVAALPIQNLFAKLFIGVVRTSALQVFNQIADVDKRFDVNCQMNVVRRAADAVKVNSLCAATAIHDFLVNKLFDFRSQSGAIVFHMPVEVQIDFMEDVARHLGTWG